MGLKESLQKAASLLAKVNSGSMNAEQALAEWPEFSQREKNKLLDDAHHFLHHFNADEDIRQKDPGYKQDQEEQLARFMDDIHKLL